MNEFPPTKRRQYRPDGCDNNRDGCNYRSRQERQSPRQYYQLNALPYSITNPSWYFNEGATNHVTAYFDKMSVQSDYTSNDDLHVGNNMSLPIKHLGKSIFPALLQPLQLHNILFVPQITKNLLSVSQLTKNNNNVYMLFFPYCPFVKDMQGETLLKRIVESGLYHLQTHKIVIPPLVVVSSSARKPLFKLGMSI